MNSVFLRIVFLIIMSLILSIIPWPGILTNFHLPWLCILLLYIQYFLPRYFYLPLLLISGLCLDVLLSTILGEHGFALLMVAWLAQTRARRFQFFSMSQQLLLIGFFCLLYQSIIISIDTLLGFHYPLWKPLATGLIAMFIWPLIRMLLDEFLWKRQERV